MASLIEKATSQGDAFVQTALGIMNENGCGIGPNMHLATDWRRKAAEQGFADREDKLEAMLSHWKSAKPGETAQANKPVLARTRILAENAQRTLAHQFIYR